MIVDTMTLDEIALELQKDKAFLGHQQQEFLKKDLKVLRTRRNLEFPYYFFHEVVSNRKNKYLMRFEIETWRELKDPYGVVYCTSYAIHEKVGKGLYAYTLKEYHDNIVEYKSHFFRRYAERTGFEGTPMEVIRHYLSHNPDEMMTTGIMGETTYMSAATVDGIAFGVIDSGHRVNRTFVTYDLLFRDQKKFQEDMMTLIRLNHLHDNKWMDEEELKGLRQKVKVEDFERVGKKLWRAYAKYHLDLDVVVNYIGHGQYELLDRDGDSKPMTGNAEKVKTTCDSAILDFMLNNQNDKPFAETPVHQQKKSQRRTTPATIARRRKK